jgi:hypothetical protein
MVSSDVLFFEIKNTPDPERVEYGLNFLSLGMANLTLTDQSINLAKDYEKLGIKHIDALHLAVAAENNIDYLALATTAF